MVDQIVTSYFDKDIFLTYVLDHIPSFLAFQIGTNQPPVLKFEFLNFELFDMLSMLNELFDCASMLSTLCSGHRG